MKKVETDNSELVNFLVWIETKQHHFAQALETRKGRGILLRGYGHEIRHYPTKENGNTWEPARDPFDSRMYRATAKGRKLIREAGRWPEVAAAQRRRSPNVARAPRDFKPGEA